MDLEELPDWLSGPDLKVETRDSRSVLTGSAFERFKDAADAHQFATEILDRVNSLGPLLWSGYEPVTTGAVLSEGGHHHILMAVAAGRARVKGKVVVLRRDGTEVPPEPPPLSVLHLLRVATTDPVVDRVLMYLRPPDVTWADLYRALEAVEQDAGDVSSRGWAVASQRRLFRHTANNFGALGIDARHGHTKNPPPAHPMSLTQARSFVFEVVVKWLRTK
jgi:hypothetical protein